ncbi:MAG: contractile injection system tape measure protein [Saprospiraceae bacterium]|nr:contractile injection system tape measure protein [Saprospiraceae bacterium]
MSKKEQKHIIKEQIIDLEIDVYDEKEIQPIQNEVLRVFQHEIGEELDRLFSRIAPPDVYIHLDKLEINLPDLRSIDVSTKFKRIVVQEVEKAIYDAIRKNRSTTTATNPDAPNSGKFAMVVDDWTIFEEFMNTGAYPTWSGGETQPIQKIFKQLLQRDPKKLSKIVYKLSHKKKIQKRLFFQFKPQDLEKLIRHLFKQDGRKAVKQLDLIRARLGKRYKVLKGSNKIHRTILEGALNYYINTAQKGRKIKLDTRDFVETIVEQVQETHESVDREGALDATLDDRDKGKVRTEFSGSYQEVDIIEHFLTYGSIPTWADVDSKESLQGLFERLLRDKLVAVQRMITKNIRNTNVLKRLIFQFPNEQVLNLLEPIPGDNLRFIEDIIEEFSFLSQRRQNIPTSISREQLRASILQSALRYVFIQRRSNFVKQSFLQQTLEDLAPEVGSNYDSLLKESYQSFRRRKQNSGSRKEILRTLESIDAKLKIEREKDQQVLKQLQKDQDKTTTRLEQIEIALTQDNLTTTERQRLEKEQTTLKRQLTNLEKRSEELGAKDITLSSDLDEIQQEQQRLDERLEKTQQRLRQQAQLEEQQIKALQQSKEELEDELEIVQKRFEKLQAEIVEKLNKVVKQLRSLQKEHKAVEPKAQSRIKKKIDRTKRRVQHFQEELQKSVDQLYKNKKNLELLVTELETALKGQLPAQERRTIEREIRQLKAEVRATEERLKSLEEEQKKTTEEIKKLQTAIDTPEEEEESAGTSKIDFILTVLQYGAIPWWADEYRDKSVEEIIKSFAKSDIKKLQQAFSKIGNNPVVWQRLVNQMSEEGLQDLIEILYPDQFGFVITVVLALERIYEAQVYKHLTEIPEKYFKWSKITEFLLTAPFRNTNDFIRDIIYKTSQSFNISPSSLSEYLTNIGNNFSSTRFAVLAHIVPQIKEDPKLTELEKELLKQETETKAPVDIDDDEQFLTNEQKLKLLNSFLQSGKISKDAQKALLNTDEDFERLLLEQITENKSTTRQLLVNLMNNQTARNIIIKRFSQATYWEIIQTIQASAVLIARKHLEDFQLALSDTNLLLEKDALLEFLNQNPNKVFNSKDYVKFVLMQLFQKVRRAPAPVMEEWKGKLILVQDKLKSTLLLSVISLEVEFLQSEQEASKSAEIVANLQQQIEILKAKSREYSQDMLFILNQEMIEIRGLNEEPKTLKEIEKEIFSLTQRLDQIKKELVLDQPNLRILELKKEQAQLDAKINLLEREKPVLLRYWQPKIDAAQEELVEITPKIRALEDALKQFEPEDSKSTSYTPSLLEEQASLDDEILKESIQKKQIPNIFTLLESLDEASGSFKETLEKYIQEFEEKHDSLATIQEQQQAIFEFLNQIERIQPQVPNLQDLQERLVKEINQQKVTDLVDRWEAINQIYTSLKEQVQVEGLATFDIENLPQINLRETQKGDISEEEIREGDISEEEIREGDISEEEIREGDISEEETRKRQQAALQELEKQLEAFANIQANLYAYLEEQKQHEILLFIRKLEIRWIGYTRQVHLGELDLEAVNELLNKESETLEKEIGAFVDESTRSLLIRQIQIRVRELRVILQAAERKEVKQALEKEQSERATILKKLQDLEREYERVENIANIAPTTESLSPEERNQAQRQKAAMLEKMRKQETAAQKIAPQPFLIKNAGLVLLWPFFSRLFKMLKYVEKKEFVSDEALFKSIHLLQFLASGQTSTPENELLLNKVLCNTPLDTPIPLTMDFSEDELKIADSLLGGAVANWKQMSKMPAGALRGSFLMREGQLIEKEDRWMLEVNKGAFDIILKTLPWGFNLIKLPWMVKFLSVEWKF